MNELLSKIKQQHPYIFIFGALGVVFLLGVILYSGTKSQQGITPISDYGSEGGSLGIPGRTTDNTAPFESSTSLKTTSSETDAPQESDLSKRKIVKNGTISLLVKNVEESAVRIHEITKNANGFIENSRVYEISSTSKAGTVTIRVPADRFDETLRLLKENVIKVEDEQTHTSDVTEQFIDFEARLTNLGAEEMQYLEIMKKAVTVEDTLRVVERLSNVRGRIEQIEGQLQYLSRQIDMSLITISLTEEQDAEVLGIRWKPLVVVKQSLRDLLTGFTSYANTLIRFVFALPLLLLWAVTWGGGLFILWKIGAFLYRRYVVTSVSKK